MTSQRSDFTRRDFLRTAAAISAGATVMSNARAQETTSSTPASHPGGNDTLRVGVIGAGGRGTGAAVNAVEAAPGVVIVALGDAFEDQVNDSKKKLREKLPPEAIKFTDDTCFHGLDNYEKVLACDVDMVILAAPPGFRPPHLKASIEAGKHVFMEKPVCVDAVGARSIIESGELATQKKLSIVTGTQRRHDPVYLETVKRIEDGAIGEVVGGSCYWCQEDLWVKPKRDEWTELEWQLRNWLYFDWLSGDHIVEQHVHNIDVMNWVMGGPPEKAFGSGGRQVRVEPQYGNIFDHFTVEYEYPNGQRVLSMCRQIKGTSHRVAEYAVGTKGRAKMNGEIEGPNAFKFEWKGEPVNPYVNEQKNLISAIRGNQPINEAKRIAESTLTAILGRMSAYTGREINFKWLMNSSKLDLTPAKIEFGDMPINPVPVPGQTELV